MNESEFKLKIYKDLDQHKREIGSNESDILIEFVLFVHYTVLTWFSHIS